MFYANRITTSNKKILFLVSALLLTRFVWSQAGTGDSAPSGSSSAKVSNVDEISLDLTVHNKKNKAVLDLKSADITVTDNASPVEISGLRLVSGANVAADHLITFLFDQMNPSAAANARGIANKMLKMIPEHGFRIAVLGVNGRLRLFQEFTSDRQAIAKAINVVAGENEATYTSANAVTEKRVMAVVQTGTDASSTPVSPAERNLEQAVLAALAESERIIQDQSSQPSLADLSAVARMQSAISGRKVVVYFTQGLEVDANTGDRVRSIVAAANRAGVSIYAINTSGVDPREFESLTQMAAIGNMMSYRNLSPTPTQASLVVGQALTPNSVGSAINAQLGLFEAKSLAGYQEPLAAVSADTGGSYVGANGNFRKPLREMIADLSTYYELSYVPHIQQYDRQFHSVAVKSQRSGLKIRTAAGYFALPPSEESGTLAFEAPLLKVLGEPQSPGDLTVRSRILQLGEIAGSSTSSLVIEVPLAQLGAREDPDTTLVSWHVSIVSRIKNKAGAVVEHFSEDIPRRGLLDAKDAARGEAASMQRHFVLPPGEYLLETAVLDRHSGKMGVARESFEIPSPTPGAFLSDVAMVRRIDPLAEDSDIFEPLRYEHSKIVPDLSGRVLPGAADVRLFFLVQPDPRVTEHPKIEMQVRRNGQLLGEIPLQLSKPTGEAFPYLASIKTESLPAGNYEVQLTLTDNGKIEERGTSFQIEGPEAAGKAATVKAEAAKPDAELGAVADTNLASSESEAGKPRPLIITSLPPDSVARPAPAELDAIIAGARQQAISYAAKLPNFLCIEITNRSVDPHGNGRWRRKDSFAELLRYSDNQETRLTLEVNGERSSIPRAQLVGWPISLGEFGEVLDSVFQPASKAEFRWKETKALGNGAVQVFEYQVRPNNARMTLIDGTSRVYAGFHGLAYIDSTTFGIRRITMEADDLPHNFSFHAASFAVDYDYVAIGPHEYLMPVLGTIRLQRGRHEADVNQIVFQGYRRYASQTKVVSTP